MRYNDRKGRVTAAAPPLDQHSPSPHFAAGHQNITHLGQCAERPSFHLDDLHWLPGHCHDRSSLGSSPGVYPHSRVDWLIMQLHRPGDERLILATALTFSSQPNRAGATTRSRAVNRLL